ncbi:MAG: efflux RND transporter permease subunit [SAR324 cluster bacterium]|nr:efflux RND transporter permease subunit [SAR324 cluster bacterium]
MIEWFAKNHVAANLLMVLILALGLYTLTSRVPLEVFPSIEMERVTIRTSFPGATPAEVEEGVTIRIEEAIQDLEGIKELSSQSSEGSSNIIAEAESGYDTRRLMEDIKSRVDALNTLPDEVEKSVVSIPQRRREVISVVVAGDVSERELRQLGEQVRDEIINLPDVTQADLEGVRPFEISIEISEITLREYGLTFADVSDAIRRGSLDLSAGSIKTQGGEILIRTKGQAHQKQDFENIVIFTRNDGIRIRLKDIATIEDGFEETPILTKFNNQSAVMIEVYRVGEQNAIDVAEKVRDYIKIKQSQLPENITITYWRDGSKLVEARLKTLTSSALQGGILVFLLLTLFLRPAIAFWVCLGIPVSFLGSALLMPFFGVTLNTFSLFAFILVLGIVVDDAIVTGENIYTHLQRHGDALKAAIEGTKEVAIPVTFGVLTTVAAFLPLAFMEGRRGALFIQIPLIVIPVLLFSLVESKIILPAHLKHLKSRSAQTGIFYYFNRFQNAVADGFEHFVIRLYGPSLSFAIRQRYLTLSLFIAAVVVILAVVMSGWMRFLFFPRVQSEVARAELTMPASTPFEITAKHIDRMTVAAQQLQQKYVDPSTGKSEVLNILSSIGSSGGSSSGRSNIGRVWFEITAPDERTVDVTSSQLVREWRQEIGPIPGADTVNFRAEIGRSSDPIDIQLSGNNFGQLQAVAEQVKKLLQGYPAVFDIADSLSDGKEELQLSIKPEAQVLGVSLSNLAQQVRQGFFGFEVQRIQRGRNDIGVVVRYPAKERQSLNYLHTMMIRTSSGAVVPFAEVAEIRPGRSPSAIQRIDRRRTINVTADINKETANLAAIKEDTDRLLSQLLPHYPDVHYSFQGEDRERRDSFKSLWWGLGLVLFVIYGLLAIPFRSYLQPLIVMTAIPFGVAGAVVGHWIMGMDLTIMSLMGMLALTGVAVNDSLVLVDYINRRRRQGGSLLEAVNSAGVARFRPVMLTSLTTFAGLAPLIFDSSTQAQFLIPMAVSLGFGVLFATLATLIVIPINYLILEDFARLYHKPEPAGLPAAKLEVQS